MIGNINLIKLYREYLIEQDPSDLGKALAELKANCLANIIDCSLGETRDAMQACKYLIDFTLEKNPRGRPPKDSEQLTDDTKLWESYHALHQGRKE